jgi:hypothetical protein
MNAVSETVKKETMSDRQLKFLFDYTKFHIGLYTTLMGAVVAFLKFTHGLSEGEQPWWLRLCLVVTLFCFLGAGACGGAIASNIPDCKRSEDFATKDLTALGIRHLKYPRLAHWEHAFFWTGILVAATSIAFSVLWPMLKSVF